jgi:hypothetical protein
MRRMLIAFIGVLAAAALAVPAALADNPHFIKASASLDNSGNLVCTFKEVGLGQTTATETVTCSATANAVYGALNNGQQCPNAANKTDVTGSVSASGDFPVRNGSVTGTIIVSPPPTTLIAPSGQSVVLISVSYTNIVLQGAAGDTKSVPGTLSANFFPQCP